MLKGQPPPAAPLDEAFEITRSLPHGHVAAVLGAARQLGLEELSEETAATSLGEVLALGSCDEDDPVRGDGLPAGPAGHDPGRAGRTAPGRAGPLVLYAASSAAFGGRTCPLGAIGHPKDGVPGPAADRLRAADLPRGHPGRDRGLQGQHRDSATVAAQVTRVKDRFGITKVVLAGDRGMLTAARLREDVAPAGLDWITALRAPQVKKLVRGGDLQLTLFDTQDLAEITSPDFPGERLVACKNPFGEAERARKRESLLAATEAGLEQPAAACARAGPSLHGQDIARRAGRQGPEPPQGRQALHRRHRRRQHQLRPRPGLHHRRGRPGRHLRAAYQRRRQ